MIIVICENEIIDNGNTVPNLTNSKIKIAKYNGVDVLKERLR